MKGHSFLSLDLPRSPELWISIYCSCIGGRKSSIWLPAGYTSIIILEQIDWKLFWWGPRDNKISLGCTHTLAGPELSWENNLGILELESTSMSCQKHADSKQSKQENTNQIFYPMLLKTQRRKKPEITDSMNKLKEIKILVNQRGWKSKMGWK